MFNFFCPNKGSNSTLYPFVKKDKDSVNKERLWIIEDAKKYITIEDWLKGHLPSYKNTVIF